MKENYNNYSIEQLIQKIKSLERENSFLKAFIRETKEFKNFERRLNDTYTNSNTI